MFQHSQSRLAIDASDFSSVGSGSCIKMKFAIMSIFNRCWLSQVRLVQLYLSLLKKSKTNIVFTWLPAYNK